MAMSRFWNVQCFPAKSAYKVSKGFLSIMDYLIKITSDPFEYPYARELNFEKIN